MGGHRAAALAAALQRRTTGEQNERTSTPGETVTVTGSTGKNGSIGAEAIKVGAGSGAGKGSKGARKRALEALLGTGG